MIRKIDSNKFSLTILKVTTFSRIRQIATAFDKQKVLNQLICVNYAIFLQVFDIKLYIFRRKSLSLHQY